MSSGFLLTLITYINPLFLSMWATWLGTFLSEAAHILLLRWSGQNCRGNFLLPKILLFSLPCLYFLSGCPTYTSCLANQHLFKTWLTEYRQFSLTNLIAHPKTLEKIETNSPRRSRWQEIIKLRAKINKIETKKTKNQWNKRLVF